MNYIAKPDTWFDEGTPCTLLIDIFNIDAGLFKGLRNGEEDEEICPYDEFEILNNKEKT